MLIGLKELTTMPHYSDTAPFQVYWCPNCRAWYKVASPPISCAVHHAPGSCCHYMEIEVTITITTGTAEPCGGERANG